MTCEIRERKAFAKQVEQNPDLLKHAAILESETQLVGVGGHEIEVTATTEPKFPQVEVGEFYVGTKPKSATKKVSMTKHGCEKRLQELTQLVSDLRLILKSQEKVIARLERMAK